MTLMELLRLELATELFELPIGGINRFIEKPDLVSDEVERDPPIDDDDA
jgi:hypothetical protein